MKKFLITICLIFVFFVNSLSFGTYLIFDNNRSYWLDYIDYGIPIVVDSGVDLGLTNPEIGEIDYGFIFMIRTGSLSFDMSNIESYPINGGVLNIGIDGPALCIWGTHNGPGNPVYGIKLYGNAIVDVLEDSCDGAGCIYETIGSFTVGEVPEPSTIFLLGFGYTLLFRKRV